MIIDFEAYLRYSLKLSEGHGAILLVIIEASPPKKRTKYQRMLVTCQLTSPRGLRMSGQFAHGKVPCSLHWIAVAVPERPQEADDAHLRRLGFPKLYLSWILGPSHGWTSKH